MLIKADNSYIEDLFSLWKEAFGDDDKYINILFETIYKENVIIFAHFETGRIVSAFYLMSSYIKKGNEALNGYYLYAAATLKSHRGKGIMERLIKEAQAFVENDGKDFISLVPGEEYLYSYYKKFGFETVMYRGKDIICCEGSSLKADVYDITFDSFFEKRDNMIPVFSHHLCTEAYKYAAKCFGYLGLRAVSFDDFSCIYDGDKLIKELICDNECNSFKSTLAKGEYTVYSCFGKKKEPFGMVWFADENRKCESIYMNIALD